MKKNSLDNMERQISLGLQSFQLRKTNILMMCRELAVLDSIHSLVNVCACANRVGQGGFLDCGGAKVGGTQMSDVKVGWMQRLGCKHRTQRLGKECRMHVGTRKCRMQRLAGK